MGVRILVIEDNLAGAYSMRMVLENLGHTLETAHDGAAGINAPHQNASIGIWLRRPPYVRKTVVAP